VSDGEGAKRWVRGVLRSARLQHVCAGGAALYPARLCHQSLARRGDEIPRRLRAASGGLIVAFGTARMMMIPLAQPRLARVHMLISAHRDGRISPASQLFDVGYIAARPPAAVSGACARC